MSDESVQAPGTFRRNFVYAGASAGSAGLLLLLFVIAGRMLGEIDFGKFSFALVLGTIFETLMDFGLHQVTMREVARDRSRATDLLHHALGIKLLWTAFGLAAMFVTATVLRPEWDVRIACYLIGSALVARSYTFTIRGILMGLERFGWDSFVVLADRSILLVCGVVALAAGTGLRGLAIAFVVARVLAAGVATWVAESQLGGLGVRYNRVIWRELQRTALPLGFFLAVLNLYSYIDGVMLGVMKGDLETGIYYAAYKVYEGLSYAPSIIASVLAPRLASLFVTDRAAHRRLALQGVAVSVAMALVLGAAGYAFAGPAIRLLFGPAFSASAVPMRILCFGLPFIFAIWICHATAMSVNKDRLMLRAATIGLVINVGVNAYAIPHAGATGAAWATVVGEIVSLTVLVGGLLERW